MEVKRRVLRMPLRAPASERRDPEPRRRRKYER
jgi:hypothetical protein